MVTGLYKLNSAIAIDWELWRAPVIQLLGGRGLRMA